MERFKKALNKLLIFVIWCTIMWLPTYLASFHLSSFINLKDYLNKDAILMLYIITASITVVLSYKILSYLTKDNSKLSIIKKYLVSYSISSFFLSFFSTITINEPFLNELKKFRANSVNLSNLPSNIKILMDKGTINIFLISLFILTLYYFLDGYFIPKKRSQLKTAIAGYSILFLIGLIFFICPISEIPKVFFFLTKYYFPFIFLYMFILLLFISIISLKASDHLIYKDESKDVIDRVEVDIKITIIAPFVMKYFSAPYFLLSFFLTLIFSINPLQISNALVNKDRDEIEKMILFAIFSHFVYYQIFALFFLL